MRIKFAEIQTWHQVHTISPQSQLSSGSFIFAYCLSALVAAGVKNVKGGLGGMIELFGPDGLYYLVQMKYIQITK